MEIERRATLRNAILKNYGSVATSNSSCGCGSGSSSCCSPGARGTDGRVLGYSAEDLASKRVGPLGKVIGVDMTPEMVSKARQNAIKGN